MADRDSINPFKDDMTGRLLLGKYRVVRRLATGGMGVVYLARQEGAAGFVKPVVIKLILPLLAGNEEFSGMFAREAKLLANLQHPGIVGAIDFAEEQDCNVMVLEYVHGFQMGEWRRYLSSKDRSIPTNVVIQIMINVLDALHHAHTLKNQRGESMKIIHRDVSPSNIMLDTEGHVKLVDFGIAFAEEAEGDYRTTNKSFKGKLPYSAPELFASQKASVRSDVYAAGVTLHEVLYGRNEFNLKDHASIIQAVLNHVPSSVHLVRDDAPEQIDEVIWKAMAKKPSHRYRSAAEFAGALRDITKVPEHKALAELTRLVQQDFGTEMSTFLGVEALASRERAWRSPSLPPTKPPNYDMDPQPAVVNTLNLSPSSKSEKLPAPASSSSKKTLIFVALGLMGLVAIGLAIFFAVTRPKTEERRFLLVQKDVSGVEDQAPVKTDTPDKVADEEPDEGDKAGSSDDAEAEPPEVEQVNPEEGKNAKSDRRKKRAKASDGKPDPTALTAAFKKRKGAVRQCFQKHPGDIIEDTTVSVVFTVAPSGKVQKAALSPEKMRSTPLGKCLLSVSESTRFPPQSEAVSFRIPLSASRVRQ